MHGPALLIRLLLGIEGADWSGSLGGVEQSVNTPVFIFSVL